MLIPRPQIRPIKPEWDLGLDIFFKSCSSESVHPELRTTALGGELRFGKNATYIELTCICQVSSQLFAHLSSPNNYLKLIPLILLKKRKQGFRKVIEINWPQPCPDTVLVLLNAPGHCCPIEAYESQMGTIGIILSFLVATLKNLKETGEINF